MFECMSANVLCLIRLKHGHLFMHGHQFMHADSPQLCGLIKVIVHDNIDYMPVTCMHACS